MKRHLTLQGATTSGGSDSGLEPWTFPDPWEELGEGVERRDGWLLNYIDILTLFLTLFAVLLVLQPSNEPPVAELTSMEYQSNSPLPMDRSESQPTAVVQVDPPMDTPIAGTPQAIPEPTVAAVENSDSEPTAAEPVPAAAKPVEPGVSLLDQPIVENRTPEEPDPLPDATDTAVNTSDDGMRTIKNMEEGVDPPSPVPPREHQDPGQHLIERLAQHRLDERVKVSQVAEGVYLEVRDNILFAQGSAELKTEGTHLLNDLAQILLDQDGIVSVEGHTDDRPISSTRYPSNWELSSGRATTVTRYLIGKGLDPAHLRAVGYADTRPLESNATPEGQARNRRVALIVALPSTLTR